MPPRKSAKAPPSSAWAIQRHPGCHIDRLPNELIAHIFSLAPSTLSTNPAKCTSPAFQIVLVCHRWRAIAMSMSSLWSDLDFDLDPFVPPQEEWAYRTPEEKAERRKGMQKLTKFAKICLKRSGNHPLSLSICERLDERMEVLRLLDHTKTKDRWESLTIFPKTLLDIMGGATRVMDLPKLRRLRVCAPENHVLLSYRIYDRLKKSKPSSSFASLSHFDMKIDLLDRPLRDRTFKGLPTHRLTHLDISGFLFAEAFSSLEAPSVRSVLTGGTPNLTHLRLTIPHTKPYRHFSEVYEELPLPSITHFSITGLSAHLWKHLSCFKFLALTHLRICEEIPEDDLEVEEAFQEGGADIPRLFETFLEQCPRLVCLQTERVDFKRCVSLIKVSKPPRVLLAHAFDGPVVRQSVCGFLSDVITGSTVVEQVREVSIYDASKSGAILVADIVDKLVEMTPSTVGEAGLVANPHANVDGPGKTIDIYSSSPIARDTLELFRGVCDSLPVDIRLHNSGKRFEYKYCRLPRDTWFSNCFE